MNIINCSDFHIAGKNPPERLDDCTKIQFIKLEEVVEIANGLDCPVVFSGDFFHTPLISESIMVATGQILNKMIHPWYFIFGNHDLQYHSLEMWNRTSLGVLWTNNSKVRHISEFEKDYGIKWSYYDWNGHEDEPGAQYLLSHIAIVNEQQIGKNSWITDDKDFCMLVNDIKQKYKLVLCGNWHKQYQFWYNNTLVINSGPVMRRSIVEREQPLVTHINLDTLETRQIHLKSARPADDVLRESSIKNDLKAHKSNITEFFEKVQERKTTYGSSFMDNLVDALTENWLSISAEKVMRDVISTVEASKRKEQV